jgi:hypothetical protein
VLRASQRGIFRVSRLAKSSVLVGEVKPKQPASKGKASAKRALKEAVVFDFIQ